MALLRYNGGKAKLVKKILPHISLHAKDESAVFCEAFVGGGSVALEVAKKYPKAKIVLNDKEPLIYAFWNQIAVGSDSDFKRLHDRVLDCKPTIEQFIELQATDPTDQTDTAFRAIFFNRTGFSASNGKRPLGGWNQDGDWAIDSRWNSKRLATELVEARKLLFGRTTVFNEDFAEVLALGDHNWTMYLDPPYYKAGNQLYNFEWKDEDHIRLRDMLKVSTFDWVLSYDFHPFIVELYNHGMTRSYPVPASYSVSKRKEIEALIVPSGREAVSPDGFSVPENFTEFYRRYPSYVRAFVERKMRWSKTMATEDFTVFDAIIEDYTQELLLFLSALPEKSKYRKMGFTDPIQLFNPSLWGGVTSGKFFAYMKMILSNRFQTVRTKEHRDALQYAEAGLGMVLGECEEFDETLPDLQTYRHFVEQERPLLLTTFDSFFEPDLKNEIPGYENKRSRMITLLRDWFVHGKMSREYKKRKGQDD